MYGFLICTTEAMSAKKNKDPGCPITKFKANKAVLKMNVKQIQNFMSEDTSSGNPGYLQNNVQSVHEFFFMD